MQLLGALPLRRLKRFGDPLLQATGLGGIKVHPQVIHQQRQRWVITPFGQGTQQTIFQMPDRQLPALRQLLHPAGTGPPAPGQQRIHITMAARQQLGRSQQRRHRAVGQQARLRNTEALIHRVGGSALNPHRWMPSPEPWP